MLLDGKMSSIKIKVDLKQQVSKLEMIYGIVPSLAIIQVGNNNASNIYIKNKIKGANQVGIKTEHFHLEENIQKDELNTLIKKLNNDDSVDGIIVQLPLPSHINEEEIINEVSDLKDVDGFGIYNKGKLFSGIDSLTPATPTGIIKMLDMYEINLEGKQAVVVGRSNIVGKPMAMMLLNRNATVTICHSKTKNLKEICQSADILVVAIGKAKYITCDMVKKGAIVIDVGMNHDENGKLCGDVDFEKVEQIAKYITPVPGGVGPLTIASLLDNTFKACIKRRGIL